MAKDWAKGFYNSAAWQSCRDSYIAKRIAIDGGLCERCGRVCGEEVHHVIRLRKDNITDCEVTLNHNNLRLLCRDCHFDVHKRERLAALQKIRAGRGVWFDEDGGVHAAE